MKLQKLRLENASALHFLRLKSPIFQPAAPMGIQQTSPNLAIPSGNLLQFAIEAMAIESSLIYL